MVINRGALAYGGSLAVACYAVMSYAICMVHFIIQGIGDGAQPLLSRYYGAGEQEALAQVQMCIRDRFWREASLTSS